MSSLNSCSFIGNVGRDPEIRSLNSGDKVANLSLACTEKWKNKSGEAQEKTTWDPVVIFGKTAEIVERYVKKGDKLYIEGAFSVRKWTDKDNNERYSTEIVIQGFGGKLVMLGSPQSGGNSNSQSRNDYGQEPNHSGYDRDAGQNNNQNFDMDDGIPF